MTVYYFEGSPIVAPFTIESKKIVLSSETASQRIFTRSLEGQRWDLSFQVVTDNPTDILLGALESSYTKSTMTMPQLTSVDNLIEDTITRPTVVSSNLAGESSLTINTYQLVSSGVDTSILKGSFIQFSGHNKIYVVTADVVASETATLNIFPSLQSNVNGGEGGERVKVPNSGIKPNFNYKRSLDSLSGVTFSDGVLADPGVIRIMEDI